ncbi:integrase arm-type DNA-binding domain-containing protein [Pseudomonas sp. GD03860]|nr:integrase arm-type DNA-binding domain-containing protein [Pseudomonas sp. GD03860]MDH0639055.1 integrase arm-type DNA-binding domain-containing protein [Pseudomonas sp. GD03860]
MPLTDTAVRQAKARDKAYTLNDSDGLSLHVSPNGTKAWHFRFSWQGKQPRISLGTYPELGLRDARELRDQARTLVAKGVDPRDSRKQAKADAVERTGETFEAVANDWWQFKAKRLTSAVKGSAEQSRRYLDKDLIPALGAMQIGDIRRAHTMAAVQRVEERGALHVAEKCRGWLNEIFRYAIARGLIEVNPAGDLDVVAALQPPVQHNPALRRHELAELLNAIEQSNAGMLVKGAIRLMLLTMVRTIEARRAKPHQFDLEHGLWTIPPDDVKQLQSRVRTESGEVPPYLVPLSRQAVEVVREVMNVTGKCKLLFTGRNNPSQIMSENTVNVTIKKMGFRNRLTGHGIRGTVSTILNELGYNKDWIEAQLSHTDPNAVRGTYNHAEYVEQRRGMMQDWADYLDHLAGGGSCDEWPNPAYSFKPADRGRPGAPSPTPGPRP